jgi:CBS domain-containing protein
MESNPKLPDFEKRLRSLKAKDMMTRSVIPAQEDMLLGELADMMLAKRISGTPVVGKDGKVSGMITATDLFILMAILRSGEITEKGKLGVCNPTVSFAMCRDIVSVKEETTLSEIMDIMQNRNIHTLPVMDGDKLLGIIGRRDVLKHFYSILREIFGA